MNLSELKKNALAQKKTNKKLIQKLKKRKERRWMNYFLRPLKGF